MSPISMNLRASEWVEGLQAYMLLLSGLEELQPTVWCRKTGSIMFPEFWHGLDTKASVFVTSILCKIGTIFPHSSNNTWVSVIRHRWAKPSAWSLIYFSCMVASIFEECQFCRYSPQHFGTMDWSKSFTSMELLYVC